VKVHFIGNICNNHYVLCKALRKLGIDAHLFLTYFDLTHPFSQALPESEDPEIECDYPKWIHKISVPRWSPLFPFSLLELKRIAKCDLIHTHGNFAPYVMFLGVPYVIHPYGADLNIYPFFQVKFPKSLHPHYSLFRKLVGKSYKKASAVILTVNPLWEQAIKVLLKNAKIVHIPLAIDTQKFYYGYRKNFIFDNMFSNSNFFIFQTARHAWRKETIQKQGGDKGNDILIKAFAKVFKKNKNIKLILIEKGQDVLYSKALIEKLGISDGVRWLRPVKRFQLIKYLHSAHLFVDSLNTTIGSAALEAMCCGVPTVVNLPEELKVMYEGEEPPVIQGESNVNNLAEKLEFLSEHLELLKEISVKQRQFIERHHSLEVVAIKLVKLYKSIP